MEKNMTLQKAFLLLVNIIGAFSEHRSNIRLVDNFHPQPVPLGYHNLYRNRSKIEFGGPEKKMGSVYSVIKGITQGWGKNEQENDQQESVLEGEQEAAPGGWGWSKAEKEKNVYHKHLHHIKGGGSTFSFLDFLLAGLSLLSLGAFLLNLLASLLSLFGFGYVTTTATVTGTGGTSTGTGGMVTVTGGVTGGAMGGAVLNSINSFFRSGLKRKKKKKSQGTISAEGGFGSTKGSHQDSTYDGSGSSVKDEYDDEVSGPDEVTGRYRFKREVWEPTVHPYASLNIAAMSILEMIESAENNYYCMEKSLCDANRRGRIIRKGSELFFPIFTFSFSYFGQKLGLHQELSEHVSAISAGVQEANCVIKFPSCSSFQTQKYRISSEKKTPNYT